MLSPTGKGLPFLAPRPASSTIFSKPLLAFSQCEALPMPLNSGSERLGECVCGSAQRSRVDRNIVGLLPALHTRMPFPVSRLLKLTSRVPSAASWRGVSTYLSSRPLMSPGSQPALVKMANPRMRLIGECTTPIDHPSTASAARLVIGFKQS